jgi:hypothetical protein
MNLTDRMLWISLVVAAGALGGGYWLGGLWPWGLALLALGALWRFDQVRGWGRLAAPGLMIFVMAAAVGLLYEVPSGLMLLATVASLAAWDLDRFSQRLKSKPVDAGTAHLERLHLKRLLIVCLLGLLLAGSALLIRFRLSFGLAVLIALLVVISLTRVTGSLRKSQEQLTESGPGRG